MIVLRLNRSILWLLIPLLACVVPADSAYSASPRVLRVVPGNPWQISVNGQTVNNKMGFVELTNYLSQLRLAHGDIVLFGKPSEATHEIQKKWLLHFFTNSKVAIYLHPQGSEIFSVPAFHWTAPFDDPRSLADASFFFEGKLLGPGEAGFNELLRELRKTRPAEVFILGGRYDVDRSFDMFEQPYEQKKHALDLVLRELGIKLLVPSQVF